MKHKFNGDKIYNIEIGTEWNYGNINFLGEVIYHNSDLKNDCFTHDDIKNPLSELILFDSNKLKYFRYKDISFHNTSSSSDDIFLVNGFYHLSILTFVSKEDITTSVVRKDKIKNILIN